MSSRSARGQVITAFGVPFVGTSPVGIAAGADGNLWFTGIYGNRIGRMTPLGVVTGFSVGISTDAQPTGITAGPDGNLWFTEPSSNRIGRITPFGVVTEFSAGISANAGPTGISAGPEGNVWFTEALGNRIGRITPSGVVTEFSAGISADAGLGGVTTGPDGNLWFTESLRQRVGRVTPSGEVTEFSAGISGYPIDITAGPDGNLWFTESFQVGRITTLGVVTEFYSPSLGPDGVHLDGIVAGPDRNLWFGDFDYNPTFTFNTPQCLIGRITTGLPVASTLVVPIVLSSSGGSAFTSELTLTNRGTTDAQIVYSYTPAFGGNNGMATDTLPAGQQRVIPDALTYLEELGLSNPGAGGTLSVTFSNLSSIDAASALVRTTTSVPEGRAGLAYAGLPFSQLLFSPVYLCGLRQNVSDRSNVAIVNTGGPSDGDLTLRLTVFSGDPGNSQSQALPDIALSPGGLAQVNGILVSNGLTLSNGYVKVEPVSGTATFYAYGVINDQVTSDGSFIAPVPVSSANLTTATTLPALVETPAYSTELILTNLSSSPQTLDFTWVAPQLTGGQATFSVSLLPGEQQILPAFVQLLRDRGVVTDPTGGTFAGALFATDESGDLRGVSIAARITSASVEGGSYGVFLPGFPSGSEATTTAWLFGLQQNTETRSNLALVNTGSVDASPSTFRIDLFDGASGAQAGSLVATVPAKGFVQINAILTDYAPGTTSAYASITRLSGNNPFIPYAVLNDGAQPGERSGDGAFVGPMIPAH